ncbi:hypothetical protein AX16_004759 [Volvariella volvacea WC 439]|nr:hypothetical protein AX16_004759 [Volvariella volvacea WC 439]
MAVLATGLQAQGRGESVIVSRAADSRAENWKKDLIDVAFKCIARFPSLFHYARFSQVQDVPVDLREVVVWALNAIILVLKETPKEVLCGTRYPNFITGFEEEAVLHMRMKTRIKLGYHLMSPHLNRPAEAIPHLKECLDMREEWHRFRPDQPPLTLPAVVYHYGEALMHTDLKEARIVLEKLLDEIQGPKASSLDSPIISKMAFNIRINLALIYRELGLEKPANGLSSYIDWVIKFLKNHDHFIDGDELRELLIKPGFEEHPVLVRLGGEEGLQKLRNATPDYTLLKHCENCLRRSRPSSCSGVVGA